MSAAPVFLPFVEEAEGERLDPLACLAARSRRLADVVEAISRRRDVRDRRAKILLLILHHRCPLSGRPARAWYVRGAAARFGPNGIARTWSSHWGEEPPSLRTIRAHLGELEANLAIIRSPGDYLPRLRDPEHPDRCPRWPDTIHVLETEREALFWAGTGRARLEAEPGLRYSPRRWARVFGGWRLEARQLELALEVEEIHAQGGESSTLAHHHRAPAAAEELEALDDLEAVLSTRRATAFELLSALKRAGCHVQGRNSFRLARSPARLHGAASLYLRARRRGDRIRNRGGWLVRAWTHAPPEELLEASTRWIRIPSLGP